MMARLKKHEFEIVLTRVGPKKLDSDGVVSSLKAVRDGIADALGVNDGDSTIRWTCEQARGIYAVKVQLRLVG